MSESVFTRIRQGDIPGYILYQDKTCFVILSNQPHHPGHVLVIPVTEVADWQDLPAEDWAHLMAVTQAFGKLIKQLYNPPKIALSAVGFEVPHAHIHVFSLFEIADIDHDKAKASTPEELKVEADKIRKFVKDQGGLKL